MPMRQIVRFVLCGLGAAAAVVPAQAQRSTPPPVTLVSAVPAPATKLEDLLARPNALVNQDLYRVSDNLAGAFGLTVDAVVATEVLPVAARLQGLRVEVSEPGPPARMRRSYLDIDELAGLSQALAQMAADAAGWSGREPTQAREAHYATAGGFEVGFHEDSRNQQGYILAGAADPVRRACAVQDFALIKAAVDEAIALLK